MWEKKDRYSLPNFVMDGQGYYSPKVDWAKAWYSMENLGSEEEQEQRLLLLTIQISLLHTVGCGAVLAP